MRYKIQMAMEKAHEIVPNVCAEFNELIGRKYDVMEPYFCDDAELIVVSSGTLTSNARAVIQEYREKGIKVGLLKIRMFRPFPTEQVRKLLMGIPKVAVIDRNISFGSTGIFFQELKAAIYGHNGKDEPKIFGYIIGLGGRDVTLHDISEIVDHALENEKPEEDIIWMGLKK
jgi:pyruvate/2-oxoacid:ferredoxin oxidoreductase alpha subunit